MQIFGTTGYRTATVRKLCKQAELTDLTRCAKDLQTGIQKLLASARGAICQFFASVNAADGVVL